MSTVLIVDDSATIRAGMAAMVRSMGLGPVLAASGEEALEQLTAAPPSLILLDVLMPGMDGYETARRMRVAAPRAWIPIIFLSSNEDDQNLERAIESGGDDYLVKPVSAVVLGAKIRALQRLDKMHQEVVGLSENLSAANQRLEALTLEDALTGIANRRAFDTRLALHFADAARRDEPLSVALCDVDHFKAYNDRYGHPAGDECLRKVASALARTCHRTTDLVARYGGEEFAVVLPDTPAVGARRVLDAARSALASLAIAHEASPTQNNVTFSAGIAVYEARRDRGPDSLVRRADEALYRAKQLGRDRVVDYVGADASPA